MSPIWIVLIDFRDLYRANWIRSDSWNDMPLGKNDTIYLIIESALTYQTQW